MAMKKRAVPQKKTSNDDTIIYKIMIALGILCILLLGLQMVSRYYRLAGSMLAVRTGLGWATGVFGVLAVAFVICWAALRRRAAFWRMAGMPLFLMALAISLSCWLLYATWVSYVSLLYFVYIALAVLYMIALLYQHEFLLLSLINTCAGCVFYALNRFYGHTVFSILLSVILVLVIALGCGVFFAARKHNGTLKLFGREVQVSQSNTSPLLFYISCVVWLICLIASAVLGSVFAYYCVYAAVAFELIAAVYYTVKLS